MKSPTRNANLLLFAMVLTGGAAYGITGMEPDDSRTFAYSGLLEGGGSPQTGLFQMRFGLFASENADEGCLLTGPTDCTLWSEEVTDVDVEAGQFSVVLGNSNPLNDTVLAQTALFLGIAVQGPTDGEFVFLGKQKLNMVPFAARAAAAKDYKVTGTLTAGNLVTSSAEVNGPLVVGEVSNSARIQTDADNGFTFFADTNNNSPDTNTAFRLVSNSNTLSGQRDLLSIAQNGNADLQGDLAMDALNADQVNVGSPTIDNGAVLNVDGNVKILGAKTTAAASVATGAHISGTAPTDGFLVYWAERNAAGNHLRLSAQSPIGTVLVSHSNRVEAGEVKVNGMIPVRKGETWRVLNEGGTATVTTHFVRMGR